jgi:hypothetical protein
MTDLSVITVNLSTSQNDWSVTNMNACQFLRIVPSADINITGIVPPAVGNGYSVQMLNTDTTHSVTLVNQSSSSSSANRFSFIGSLSAVLIPNASIALVYDSISGCWRTAAGGLQGPTGPTGPAGADSTVTGPTGPTGPTGAASTVTGPTGPTGPSVNLTGPITSVGAATAIASQTGTGTKFVMSAGPVFDAGTASAGTWPKLTAGTLLTTAEAGALELDANALYGTTDAGNRGVIPVCNIIRADATRTFATGTAQQAIFNSPANGTLTLETGCYLFEGLIAMDTMSATSGNGKFSLIGAGGATLGSILWQAYGNDGTAETTGAATGGSWHIIATETATNIVTAAIGTALCFLVKGTFEVTVAGTIIPSFAQTTSNAAVVNVGSYFMCNRIGSTSLTSVGQWT